MRDPPTEPTAQVTMGIHHTYQNQRISNKIPWILPTPGIDKLCPRRPRCNWIIETAKEAWKQYKMYEHLPINNRYYTNRGRNHIPKWSKAKIGDPKEFNYQAPTHVRLLIKIAREGRY